MNYLFVFAFLALCVYFADKCRGLLRLLVLLIGLVVPALLAGFRDETVGVDVLAYAKWMCLTAQRLDFLSFLNFESGVASIGWNVFTRIATGLTGGLPGYLFCIEFACVILVYSSWSKLERRLFGYLSELMLDAFVRANGPRAAELPVLLLERQNLPKRYASAALRKLGFVDYVKEERNQMSKLGKGGTE